MNKTIALIPGDGIGPEVVAEGEKILNAIAKKFGHTFIYKDVIAGGRSIDKFKTPLTKDQLDTCIHSDAVLLGAVGGPKWDNVSYNMRPEKALTDLRSGLKVFANLRPAVLFPQLKNISPLKESKIAQGVDILIVRELIGGIYFGDKNITMDGRTAYDTEKYTWSEVERVVTLGCEMARGRKKKVCIVDKANILLSSRIWRSVGEAAQKKFDDIEISYMYVDNAAMQLVRDPSQFDVIITSNMFGDILSDEAAQITGSIGMLPSASLGKGNVPGLYEGIHGSAPDIAGKNVANPIATILSVAMMLRYSFKMEAEYQILVDAVADVLNEGWRTLDISADLADSNKLIGTKEMGDIIEKKIFEI